MQRVQHSAVCITHVSPCACRGCKVGSNLRSNAQNPLHTFPRNFPSDGEAADLLRTCYGETGVMDFSLQPTATAAHGCCNWSLQRLLQIVARIFLSRLHRTVLHEIHTSSDECRNIILEVFNWSGYFSHIFMPFKVAWFLRKRFDYIYAIMNCNIMRFVVDWFSSEVTSECGECSILQMKSGVDPGFAMSNVWRDGQRESDLDQHGWPSGGATDPTASTQSNNAGRRPNFQSLSHRWFRSFVNFTCRHRHEPLPASSPPRAWTPRVQSVCNFAWCLRCDFKIGWFGNRAGRTLMVIATASLNSNHRTRLLKLLD